MIQRVPFITIEDGDDLIVSFAIGPHALSSLTLLRTPKFESLLPEDERGVSVSARSDGTRRPELLVTVQWGSGAVQLTSTLRQYSLDISAVDPDEIREAKAVLRKMNFDQRFEVHDV